MAKASPGILVASESFICELGGETFDIRAGDLIEPEHPLVKKYPGHFKEPVYRFPAASRVEQATAAPGEKR
jgi:nitrite reductase/ring-hydroxylating ferredoxin subunit